MNSEKLSIPTPNLQAGLGDLGDGGEGVGTELAVIQRVEDFL